MRAIPINTEGFFKRSVGVAEHYGFRNIDDLQTEARKKGSSVLDLNKEKGSEKNFEQHILATVLKKCNNAVELKKKQPLMFYTPSIVSHPAKPSVRISTLSLNAVGTTDPLTEIILLKSAASIFEELGIKNYHLRVNSIGDKDSSVRFVREVTTQLRQRLSELSEKEIVQFRNDPSAFIAHIYSTKHSVTNDLPSPLEFLTTPSRRHFKELLELLEFTDIPFSLDERLYADHRVYSHTIHEFIEEKESDDDEHELNTLARGGRYDELTRPYVRSTVPSSGTVIAMRTKDQRSTISRPRRRKPKACLVHIGREARIASISVVETFRREKIPIEQCLHFERFSDQMTYAQSMKTKYIIIMGQREVRDGVVLLRNNVDRSQVTIPLTELTGIFKTLKTTR